MRRSLSLTVATMIGLSVSTVVFAVGSGGGGGSGGTPTCSKDTYGCSDWSACSLSGSQVRRCTLTYDCPYVADPKPAESRSCTPSCTADTWSCGSWSACASSGKQTRTCKKTFDCPLTDTPSPVTTQSCSPKSVCSADTWACADWGTCGADGVQTRSCSVTYDCPTVITPSPGTSQPCTPDCAADTWNCGSWTQCDTYGNQTRACDLAVDCPGVVMDEPSASQRCDHVQCDQSRLYDRVWCRLNLAPAGVARDLEIQYLPEPCRLLDESERTQCIGYYREFNACWTEPVGERRFACARKVLGIGDVRQDRRACGADQACLAALREKTIWMIAFRFYDLEQRAEALIQSGDIDLDVAARFVTRSIENKITLYRATTYEDRRESIQTMRDDWRDFLVDAGKV